MKNVWGTSVVMLMMITAAGCTGKKSGTSGAGVSRPALMGVAIFPDRPRAGEPIEARVDVQSNPGVPVVLVYQWLRNGAPVPGAGGRAFDSRGSQKGDQISVRVQIQGQEGQMESRRITLINTPPKIQTVSITPSRPMVGQELAAVVRAEDADGDKLSYQYQWVKGGSEVAGATQASFPAGLLKRGNEMAVSAVVSDGEAQSEKVPSLPVTVSGRPPVILSQPPAGGPQMGTFSYQVVAQDPEGGAVSFSLVSGPSGMKIDPRGGLLTWPLPQARGGAYPVVVRVANQDGYADQTFTLRY